MCVDVNVCICASGGAHVCAVSVSSILVQKCFVNGFVGPINKDLDKQSTFTVIRLSTVRIYVFSLLLNDCKLNICGWSSSFGWQKHFIG